MIIWNLVVKHNDNPFIVVKLFFWGLLSLRLSLFSRMTWWWWNILLSLQTFSLCKNWGKRNITYFYGIVWHIKTEQHKQTREDAIFLHNQPGFCFRRNGKPRCCNSLHESESRKIVSYKDEKEGLRPNPAVKTFFPVYFLLYKFISSMSSIFSDDHSVNLFFLAIWFVLF